MKEIAQFLGKKLDTLTAAVKENKPAASGVDRQLATALARLEKAVQSMQKPQFSGSVSLDSRAFSGEIGKITKEIGVLTKQLRPADNAALMRELAFLNRAIEKQPWDKVITALNGVQVAVGGLNKKNEKIPTFKLEEDQLRSLRGASAGGFVGGGETLLARSVRNTQIAITDANTEYSYTFPANTLMWRLKLRAMNASFKYSWVSGTLSGSGDASAYMSVPQNFLDSRQGVDFSGKTIYFETTVAGQVMEVEVYTA